MAHVRWLRRASMEKRREKAERKMQKLRKKGKKIEPVAVEGGQITTSFWGDAWCNNLDQFSQHAHRLPRGRAYVRSGLVCHLATSKGKIEAIVCGSELYHIVIRVSPLTAEKWNSIRDQCAGKIGSVLELIQGHLSHRVREIMTDRSDGLFPKPSEIYLSCNCPDPVVMCKHVAATLYATGARFDRQPELLFQLRDIDHVELISAE